MCKLRLEIKTSDNVEFRPESIKQGKEGQVLMLKATFTKKEIILCTQVTEQDLQNSETKKRSKNKQKLDNIMLFSKWKTWNTHKN